MADQTIFERMRNLAVTVTAEALKFELSDTYPEVWGVVMEHSNLPVIAIAIGQDTSLYFGVHSGFRGIGWVPEIREASDYLLEVAQWWYPRAEPIESYESPGPGFTSFLFHGWEGRRRVLIQTASPGKPGEAQYALLWAGENIITQTRLLDQAGKLKPKEESAPIGSPAPE